MRLILKRNNQTKRAQVYRKYISQSTFSHLEKRSNIYNLVQ